MSATSRQTPRRRAKATSGRLAPRVDDPRVVRSRAAVVDAARTLFLEKGYAGTTMEDIAARAGIAKRTLYNNYVDKEALFTQIVTDTTTFAEEFARGLRAELADVTKEEIVSTLHDLARRLALGIMRPEVIALRRLLIGESRAFPALAREYFERAPGQVLRALTATFEQLSEKGLLRVMDARYAAEQFAYLVAGARLDRAMLVSTTPPTAQVVASAREGVATFLARYGVAG